MDLPPVVSKEEWEAASAELRAKEKREMKRRDALAAERRRLPRMLVARDYEFEAPGGRVGLADLFEGRRQLIVYHHMLGPDDPAPCEGCCMFTDQVGHLAHFHARDTSLALVSAAPIGQIEAFRGRMGWEIPWYELVGNDFNTDFGVTTGFGLNVFLRDGDEIYRTYFTTGRGVEPLGSVWSFLDLTPLGRQEIWEDSPAGYPQGEPYGWWRLHDEY